MRKKFRVVRHFSRRELARRGDAPLRARAARPRAPRSPSEESRRACHASAPVVPASSHETSVTSRVPEPPPEIRHDARWKRKRAQAQCARRAETRVDHRGHRRPDQGAEVHQAGTTQATRARARARSIPHLRRRHPRVFPRVALDGPEVPLSVPSGVRVVSVSARETDPEKTS